MPETSFSYNIRKSEHICFSKLLTSIYFWSNLIDILWNTINTSIW